MIIKMDSFIWINLKRNLFSLIVSGFCLCLFASAQDESRKSEDKEKSEIVKENQTETSSSGVTDSEIEYIVNARIILIYLKFYMGDKFSLTLKFYPS